MTQQYKAVIFDLDGVLIDSEAFYYERRKKFLAQYGLSINKIPTSKFIGADMRSLWDLIFEVNETNLNRSFLTRSYLEYKKENPMNYLTLIDPNAKKILENLKRKKYKIGLASSSSLEVIMDVLKQAHITDFFDVVISGTQFKQSKPNPEIYEYTVNQMSIASDQCLVIEDSEKGIQAAYAANLDVWAIKDTRFKMDQTLANRLISTLDELNVLL